jgi:hypothetical protein
MTTIINTDQNTDRYPFLLDTPSNESIDFFKTLKNFRQEYSIIEEKFKTIKTVDLTQAFQMLSIHIVESGFDKNSVETICKLAEFIPLEKIEDFTGVEKTLDEIEGMIEEAKLYLEITKEPAPATLYNMLQVILENLLSLIETIILGLGVGDFFKQSENDLHANFKSGKIMMLTALFTTILSIVTPYCDPKTSNALIGFAFATLIFLSIIWPKIKPIPRVILVNSENWSEETKNKNFICLERKASLDEIASIIKMNRHAILVGPSRVGKSLTAKSFAALINSGYYPELKGKTVFRINMADIVEQKASFLGGGNNILGQISEAMGRHTNNIILVFDEIHMACTENTKMSDKLKIFLDEGGAFPHVIGITTTEEYNKYIKTNTAFANRFDRVDISSTDEAETLSILSSIFLRTLNKPLIESGAIAKIYNKSKEKDEQAPQPMASIKILERCLNLTKMTQRSETEKKIIDVSNKILSIRLENILNNHENTSKETFESLEKEIKTLKKLCEKEKKEILKLSDALKLLDQFNKLNYQLIVKIQTLAQKNIQCEKEIKLFYLIRRAVVPSLKNYITDVSKKFGINSIIDEKLINKAVE